MNRWMTVIWPFFNAPVESLQEHRLSAGFGSRLWRWWSRGVAGEWFCSAVPSRSPPDIVEICRGRPIDSHSLPGSERSAVFTYVHVCSREVLLRGRSWPASTPTRRRGFHCMLPMALAKRGSDFGAADSTVRCQAAPAKAAAAQRAQLGWVFQVPNFEAKCARPRGLRFWR